MDNDYTDGTLLVGSHGRPTSVASAKMYCIGSVHKCHIYISCACCTYGSWEHVEYQRICYIHCTVQGCDFHVWLWYVLPCCSYSGMTSHKLDIHRSSWIVDGALFLGVPSSCVVPMFAASGRSWGIHRINGQDQCQHWWESLHATLHDVWCIPWRCWRYRCIYRSWTQHQFQSWSYSLDGTDVQWTQPCCCTLCHTFHSRNSWAWDGPCPHVVAD